MKIIGFAPERRSMKEQPAMLQVQMLCENHCHSLFVRTTKLDEDISIFCREIFDHNIQGGRGGSPAYRDHIALLLQDFEDKSYLVAKSGEEVVVDPEVNRRNTHGPFRHQPNAAWSGVSGWAALE